MIQTESKIPDDIYEIFPDLYFIFISSKKTMQSNGGHVANDPHYHPTEDDYVVSHR